MTAQEKAKELVDKVTATIWDSGNTVSKPMINAVAILAVDELLKIFDGLHKPEYTMFDIYEPKQYTIEDADEINGYMLQEYWEEVKYNIASL